MCFITFNKGYVVFPSPEIKFLPINIFLGIYDLFFSVKYLSLKELKRCIQRYHNHFIYVCSTVLISKKYSHVDFLFPC